MIIDTHVHFPPDCDKFMLLQILSEAAKNGINLLIASDLGNWAHYPEKGVIHQANVRAKKFAEYAPVRIRWQAYLNPQLDNWRDELEYCVTGGACGIKLWIALKEPGGDLRNTVAVLEKAVAEKLPVLLHVFNRTDANRPGEISITEFATLAKTVPECVMIAAHAGGNWRYSMGMLRDCGERVYLDISGSYPEQGMVEQLLKSEGAGRLVFGSDAVGRSFNSQVAKVTLAAIDGESKEKILWQNAASIYHIDEIPALTQLQAGTTTAELPDLSEDHFCFCGNWPFRDFPVHEPRELEKLLTSYHFKKAYVADLGSIFHLEPVSANWKFSEICRDLRKIRPLATLNPVASNWTYPLE
jgi:predicted TIM-barrel fold metal-dependent hydrolase